MRRVIDSLRVICAAFGLLLLPVFTSSTAVAQFPGFGRMTPAQREAFQARQRAVATA